MSIDQHWVCSYAWSAGRYFMKQLSLVLFQRKYSMKLQKWWYVEPSISLSQMKECKNVYNSRIFEHKESWLHFWRQNFMGFMAQKCRDSLQSIVIYSTDMVVMWILVWVVQSSSVLIINKINQTLFVNNFEQLSKFALASTSLSAFPPHHSKQKTILRAPCCSSHIYILIINCSLRQTNGREVKIWWHREMIKGSTSTCSCLSQESTMNFNVMLIFEAAFYVLLHTYVESYRFKGLGVLVITPAVPVFYTGKYMAI